MVRPYIQLMNANKLAESELSWGLRPYDTSCGISPNTLQTKKLDPVCQLPSAALQLLRFDIL